MHLPQDSRFHATAATVRVSGTARNANRGSVRDLDKFGEPGSQRLIDNFAPGSVNAS